jgi:hypothetical protein
MANAPAWRDEYTLLCERCGYVVEGLPTEGACPECGKPIAESLPERRTGSPWQRDPTVRTLFVTWIVTLTAPRRLLDNLSITEERDGKLANICAWYAVVPPCFVGVVALLANNQSVPYLPDAWLPVAGCVGVAALWACVRGLIWIEWRGLQVISRTRGFRTTPALAHAITAHGAVGWVVAGMGLTLMILGPLGSMLTYRVRGVDTTTGRLGVTVFVFGFLWIAFGFLFFETFAWLGLRRLKYANRPRPDNPPASGAGS